MWLYTFKLSNVPFWNLNFGLFPRKFIQVINLWHIDFPMPMGVQRLPRNILWLLNSIDYKFISLDILCDHSGFDLIRQPGHVPLILNILRLLLLLNWVVIFPPFLGHLLLDLVLLSKLFQRLLLLLLKPYFIDQILFIVLFDLLDLLSSLPSFPDFLDHFIFLHFQQRDPVFQFNSILLYALPV